jgi:hypothetical protein
MAMDDAALNRLAEAVSGIFASHSGQRRERAACASVGARGIVSCMSCPSVVAGDGI